MNALVTGGAGFIGSHVAEHLLNAGHKVVVLDDLSGGAATNVPSAALLLTGSITDADLVDRICRSFEIDVIYHLAAYAAEGLSHFIRRFNYENNVIGSVNLINAAINHNVKRFVFTSSIAVYGAQAPPFDESMQPQPMDPYGVAKWSIEQDLEIAHRTHDLQYTIFRPHNVFGERQNLGDRYRNVVGIFMNQCMKEYPMSIFGDGTQRRAFTHVDNVAPWIASCWDTPATANKTYNIGGDVDWSVNDLAAVVAREMGVPGHVVYLPHRHEAHVARSSHFPLIRDMGYKLTVSTEDGIRRMAAWAKDMGPATPSSFGKIEIERNLPPSWKDNA